MPWICPCPSDCSIRRLTSRLVSSANTVVTSVVPATISATPNASTQAGCWENEKSPKPTVAIVSTVK